jgi:competence protein ComEC
MSARKHIHVSYRNETPFARMMVCFIIGIVVQLFFPVKEIGNLFLLLVAVIFFLMIHTHIKKFSGNWKIRWIAGLNLQSAFFLAGILLTYLNTGLNDPNHFQYQSHQQFYCGIILKPLSEKSTSYKTIAEIFAVSSDKKWKRVSGNVLVYFKKDDRASKLKYGDRFCFSSKPVNVSEPQNPEEFNYKRFLFFHQVYQQVYLGDKSWCMLQGNDGNAVIAAAYKVREIFIGILRDHIKGQREFAVASALVVGYEDEVDQELINAYASAGALHVLSVSGMHVGLIYQGLFLMLGFMNRKKWSRHCLFAFLICFIWFYAFLTGFSASVARSAVMLTVVIIGKWHGGSTNVFNTLIVSAFALLIYNPFLITEVGFQLSFLAVWGIIYFHPKIFLLLEPSSKFLHWVWEITSISLAAQLMTFPLGLLYFHQFPNLFMLSNLIVIPLSGIIIYACIAVLAFSPINLLCIWISKITEALLWFLNASVLFVDKVPGAIISRIYISTVETWIIYFMLASTTAFLLYRRPSYLQVSLVLLMCLVTAQLYEKYQNLTQKKIIIYNIPKQHAIDFISGEKHLFLADSMLIENKQAMLFHIIHNWWSIGMKTDEIIFKEKISEIPHAADDIFIQSQYILFENKKILIADKNFDQTTRQSDADEIRKMKIDYLIISDNSVKSIKEITSYIDCKKIIIDSSNSKFKAEKLIEESRTLGIACYSVPDKGAFVENF